LKRKVFNTLFALVLVLSLSLVTFVPAIAQEDPWIGDPEAPILIVILSGASLVGFQGEQAVSGQGWVVDDEIELYINGEYVATTVAQPNAEGNATPMFDTHEWGVIEPGDEVTIVRVSDDLSKDHVVASFAPTFVYPEADIVAGTADPGANILVTPMGDGDITTYIQFVTANAKGYWSADFESTYDITCDTVGFAGQYDDDYDTSAVFWSATATSKLAPASILVKIYGGLKEAAEALQFDSVKELQEAIKADYAGE